MTERPILFSAPMVRGLLAGTKTQTRRTIKLPPAPMHLGQWEASTVGGHGATTKPGGGDPVPEEACIWHTRNGATVCCPYGVPGDVLWVRETLKRAPDQWTYAADGEPVGWPARRDLAGKARDTIVSIHMPRWASRISLRITDVRVERVNEISVSDCYAEGCFRPDPALCLGSEVTIRDNARGEYRRIWEAINGPGSWSANPWVWAVSFERIT